jgi:hypothetical protein
LRGTLKFFPNWQFGLKIYYLATLQTTSIMFMYPNKSKTFAIFGFYIHIYMCTYMCTCVHPCVLVYIHVYMCTWVSTCVHVWA